MLSRIESPDTNGDSNSGRLLRDIEEIGKALYLPKPTPRGDLISQSKSRSKSAERTRVQESNSNSKRDVIKEDLLLKDKKKSSLWNWKKPLKALTHIRNRKFNSCFSLHVHSIEGLPANFNDVKVCVHWKKNDEVLSTLSAKVDQGRAEFEETLTHHCLVYGHRSGSHHSAKYEEKIFLVYVSVVEAPRLDIGRHWVDLTRLFPLTFEELEGEKSKGEWMTSFKLTGEAKGAILNVSFGYSLMGNDSVEPSKPSSGINVHDLLNVKHNTSSNVAGFGPGNANGILRRLGSVPNNTNRGHRFSSQSMDAKVLPEFHSNPQSELSRSINFLLQKLDVLELNDSAEYTLSAEHLKPLEPKAVSFVESAEEHFEREGDACEFTVIEQGIELSMKEQMVFKESADQMIVASALETIHMADIIQDDGVAIDEETKCYINFVYDNQNNEAVMDECKYKQKNVCTNGSIVEELESTFNSPLLQESAHLGSPLTLGDFLQQNNYMDDKASTMVRSLSLDDFTESVASDFLNMLGMEQTSYGLSSDTDPESPRECLLRQFEMETLSSGNFIFDTSSHGEEAEVDGDTSTGPDFWDFCEDFELSLAIQSANHEQKGASQLLRSRRKAKMLENLETEALMKKWGLNDMSFQSNTCSGSDAFGSPIVLSPEKQLELPSLEEGLGPYIQTKDGGFVRSMNPSLFRNAKNGGSLILQVSCPMVLPPDMGSGIMEILQHFASVGIEKLSMQVNKLMPLEDITGKTMQQVAQDAATILEVPERFIQSPARGDISSDHVSFKDLSPLAMDRIEALSIEGLRIQFGMSDEAPSSIHPRVYEGVSANLVGSLSLGGAAGLQVLDVGDCDSDAAELMDISITLDEWLRLDAGITGDVDHFDEHTLKILAVYHAEYIDLLKDRKWDTPCDRKGGLLGNNLTVAFMVQLRDFLRNYEPVGAPMLALIQVERVYVPLKPKIYCPLSERGCKKEDDHLHKATVKEEMSEGRKEEKDEDDRDIPQFKIIEVNLAGLNTESGKNTLWGTSSQQRSGFRWLLASGLGKTNKPPFLKSTAIVKSSRLATAKVQPRDFLWSISSCVNGIGVQMELGALNLHMRNPDVSFLH